MRFVKFQVLLYNSSYMFSDWKNFRFILSDTVDSHQVDNLLTAVHKIRLKMEMFK